MAIICIPIMVELDPMSIELVEPIEVAIGIVDILPEASMDMGMVIPDIDIGMILLRVIDRLSMRLL
jgi:hypothetical protein